LTWDVQESCIRTGIGDMIPTIKMSKLYKTLQFGGNCLLGNSSNDYLKLFDGAFDEHDLKFIWNCWFNQLKTDGMLSEAVCKQFYKDVVMMDEFAMPFLKPIADFLIRKSNGELTEIQNNIVLNFVSYE